MQKKLVIAADVDRAFLDRAGSHARFEVVIRPVESEDDLARVAADAQILVTRAYHRITRRVIESAPRLELIAQGTSGIDNIDAVAAKERGVAVIHLPGGNANAVAELVAGLMISLTRTIPAYTREILAGRWYRGDCANRHELRHYRLGIVGLGEVGRRLARLAAAFSMRVYAFDPYLTPAQFEERGATAVSSLATLAPSSDILTIHVPLTDETRGMIGAATIASVPAGSVLINTSRGEVLDQSAALDALAKGHLAGLALDVFDPEPPRTALPDNPRLILTPHIAGCSFESKSSIGALLFERIVEFYGDSKP